MKGSGDEECGEERRWGRGSSVRCCGYRSHCNGCMNIAWALFWKGSRTTKPCLFPYKEAAAGDEKYLVCAAGAFGFVLSANCCSYVFCNNWLFLCA